MADRDGLVHTALPVSRPGSRVFLLKAKPSWEKQFPQPRVSPDSFIAAGVELLASLLSLLCTNLCYTLVWISTTYLSVQLRWYEMSLGHCDQN